MKFPFNEDHPISIESKALCLEGILHIPIYSKGIILFVHGSGSSRLSPRNQYVAHVLNQASFATLLFDLLNPEEEKQDTLTAELRFDIPFLASRLLIATAWILEQENLKKLPIAYFGASTGAAAAIVAAAQRPKLVKAIVSRGGRPDLAKIALSKLETPILLIVGENDSVVIDMNQEALSQIQCRKDIKIVPGASHLFEEQGALEEVSLLAKKWFIQYLN